jgi:ABC-type multidrug transport system fused ATPase/permease subunit
METLIRLVRYCRPFWGKMALSIAAMAGMTVLSLVPPLLLRTLIDQVLGGPRRSDLLPVLIGAMLAVQVGNAALVAAQLWLAHLVSYGFSRMVRNDLYAHLQHLSLSFYESRQTGELMSRLTGDVEEVRLFVEHGADALVSDGLKLVGIAVVLLALNAPLALVALAPVPVMALLMVRFARQVRPKYKDTRERLASVSGRLQDNLTGVRVIKAFSQEEREGVRFGTLVREHYESQLDALAVWGRYNPAMALLNGAGSVLVLGFGASLILAGKLTLGELFAFTAYVAMFYQPIRNLAQVNDTLQLALAGTDRLFEVLDEEPEVKDTPGAVDPGRLKGRISLKHVTFRYATGEVVLDGISLDIRPGERVALVGRSGAGKTTLINLVARFYDPTAGRVEIDGRDVRETRQRELRAQMAMVLQDSFLFNGTVRENIAYGRPEASMEEVEAAARMANAHGFVSQLPQGYETQIGERGVKLSGGQKQRLAIARAVLTDPAILILDEATSSVDAESEALIQQALRRVMEGRTTLIIAHRLSTIQHADTIVVLEGGRIAEQGTHAELYRRGGVYRGLYDLQFALQAQAELPEASEPLWNPTVPSPRDAVSSPAAR